MTQDDATPSTSKRRRSSRENGRAGSPAAQKNEPATPTQADSGKDSTNMLAAVLTFDFAIVPFILIFLIDWTTMAPVDPQHFKVPEIDYEGSLTPNSILSMADKLVPGEVPGPECVLYHQGHLYASTNDGRIVDVYKNNVRTLATIKNSTCGPLSENEECGRPLGMRLSSSGDLYVADADMGVFKIHLETGIKEHVYESSIGVGGRASRMINDIALAADGTLYITDTSYKWSSRDSLYILAENRPTGRLFKFDPKTGQTELLVAELHGANGVQLSSGEDYLLISESPMCRVMRYWLKGEKAGMLELFANVPGIPDNIRPSRAGGYWVAIAFARHPTRLWFYEYTASRPWIRRIISKVFGKGLFQASVHIPYGLIVELDGSGNILRSFHDPTGKVLPAVSHVDDQGTHIYLGSFATDYIARLDLRKV